MAGPAGTGRHWPQLGSAVPTPRAAVPGCRDRSAQVCRDIRTQTARERWTSWLELHIWQGFLHIWVFFLPKTLRNTGQTQLAVPNPSGFSFVPDLL